MDLRDVVWLPAQFTWVNGGNSSGLIPTRYPGSESSVDPMIQLARKTEWEEIFDGVYKGMGQSLLATNVEDYAVLDVRQVILHSRAE